MRFALRTLAKRPGFTAVAALTLALGIGATTAVFSIVDAVLLRPLHYKDPDRLAAIWITSTREKGHKLFATHADYEEFRRHADSFENVAAATWATRLGRVLTGNGPARDVLTVPATANFFNTLGVTAAIGRTFRADDEKSGCSLVVAHKFWTSTLHADPSAVGKSLTLDQNPCTVLGVMPERFSFYPTQAQAWVLLGPGYQAEQDKMLVGIFARLKPGVTLAQARDEVYSLYRASHQDGETRDFEPVVYVLHGEFTFLAGRTLRTTLILLFASVLLVMLIACLNVANLLLARLSERRREFAVRAALGSGQGRLIRQVLGEGLLLSGLGATLGIAIAYAAVRYFRVVNPIELSVGADVNVSPLVLAFSIILAVATTLIFALFPALRASRVDLTQHLKSAGRGSIHGRHGLAKFVIGVEMALSFLLLTAAGLFMTSALRMGSENLGFSPSQVVAMRVSLPASRYSNDAQRVEFYGRLIEGLQRMPGVANVSVGSKLPPEAGGNQVVEIQGRSIASGGEIHGVGADAVSSEFFDTLSIPVRLGRAFGSQDRVDSQPVAIVNESFAKKYFQDGGALGRQIRLQGGRMPWLTVVGVVGNLKHTELMNEMAWVETPILYRPLAQEPRESMMIALRAAGDTGSAGREIQRQIAALDALIPINDVESLQSRVAKTLAYPRFRARVLSFFALSALLLSAVGLHGVLSQLVVRRMAEFGIRKAVGARTHHLLFLIARQGGVPVIAGLAAGIVLTIASGRVVANLLCGIQPADPKSMAMVALMLVAGAAAAILLPAGRAARVDPMIALRDD